MGSVANAARHQLTIWRLGSFLSIQALYPAVERPAQSSDEATTIGAEVERALSCTLCPHTAAALLLRSRAAWHFHVCSDTGRWMEWGGNTIWGSLFLRAEFFSTLAPYWEVLSVWSSADKQPDLRSQARFGLATSDVFIMDSRRQFGWPGNHVGFSCLNTLGCELHGEGTVSQGVCAPGCNKVPGACYVLQRCWGRKECRTGHHYCAVSHHSSTP